MTDETPALPDDQLQIVLAARPVGVPQASDFRAVRGPVPTPADGEVLVRSAYLSLDPAMRGWMTDRKSYLPPVPLDGVMRGLVLGEVVASRDDRFAVGDAVSGVVGWQEYGVLPGDQLDRVPGGVRPEEAMGPLGMTGLTAYFGLFDVGAPKAGETVLVSAAAGAVGSIVGQLAKIHGCRVVGTAGSDAKCAWLVDELGFDAAVNYRDADGTAKGVDGLQTELNAACPKGVDVYFDNVGGDLLDAALRMLRRRGRIVLCGAIAQYNAEAPPPGPQHYLSLLINRGRMQGFIVFDYAARYAEAQKAMLGWMREGRLQHRSHVVDGLDNAPEALNLLWSGGNRGKLMVRIGPDPAALAG